MANVEKLNINNINYDIADATARSQLSGKQEIFQVDTLPVASEDLVGNIYQYMGNTDPFVNGYFYQCKAQGTSPETYAFVQIDVQPASKTVDENGNLYLTDDFALNVDDEQYPLIYRTKSEDDSNVIKINAPVEIEEYDGVKRSLKVSGSLSASDTKVKSLTIDGTIRAHGNIWMGRTSLRHEDVIYISDESGNTFRQIGWTGQSYQWADNNDPNVYVYTANYWPNIDENIYNDEQLTDQSDIVVNVWSERTGEEWDSSKASIKDVKAISFHNDANGVIDNVYKIRGQNWNIEGNGRAELDSIHAGSWELDGDGTFRGKKIELNSGNNRMGSLHVDGAIHVNGESTVTGTSHHFRDIKLYPKESGDGYARIYPEVNETGTLGTPQHRFEKLYVKDLDVSGEGGLDISHLDGVEEINEDTMQFEKLSESASGYYNEDGQYVGSTVLQYINSEDDLPLVVVSIRGANNLVYKYGAKVNNYTIWQDSANPNNLAYTYGDSISVGQAIFSDNRQMGSITTIASIQKEAALSAINSGFNYDGEIEDVSEIAVEGSDCQGITIDYPYYYGGDDVVYRYAYNGNGSYGSYAIYMAENSRGSDWIGGDVRRYLWMIRNNRCPEVGDTVYCVNDDGSNPNNGNPLFNAVTVKSQVRQYVECIRGLTTQGGSNPGDVYLIRIGTGGQTSTLWHGQYWDGSQLVDTYGWTTNGYNPRVGDTIYRATYDKNAHAATKYNDVIGTVTEIHRPQNSVAISNQTGSVPAMYNYTQKHFNYYEAQLVPVNEDNSKPVFAYGGYYNNLQNQQQVRIDIDAYPQGGTVDSANSTFATGQYAYVYDYVQFLTRFSSWPNAKYLIITQNPNYPDNPRAIRGTAYDSNDQFLFNTNTTIEPDGRAMWFGVQFTGVLTVDSNTSVKIDIHRHGSSAEFTLDAGASTPMYFNTELVEMSNLTWAYYYREEHVDVDGTHYLWRLSGGRTNPIPGNYYPYDIWLNSKTDVSGNAVRNPQVGDKLYMYSSNTPYNVVTNGGNRPTVMARTTVKAHRWKQDLGGGNITYNYTFARNPELNSYSWSLPSWGGIYFPGNYITTLVPLSVSGIYYLNSTSQYLYYDGSTFEECFYREETNDNIYSDIKLNNFYYWRALDGSYTLADGKEHETVATFNDLPRPDIITITEAGYDNIYWKRYPAGDANDGKAWRDYRTESLIRYTDATIDVNHVGDKIYSDSSLDSEVGSISNITYSNEKVKVNNIEYELNLYQDNINLGGFLWIDEDGTGYFSRTPNPEVGDKFYREIEFESEYGTVQEILDGEPKAGTFYVLETYDPLTTSGRYFWNGSNFVEAEKLYKTITLYGDDNDLGKIRKPWKNVYAEAVESPYGSFTTKNCYLEVNGGKITNVTEINYNGADYIYTNTAIISVSIIDDGTYTDIKPVELTSGYCKWQSESNSSIVYYTSSITVSTNDSLYTDNSLTTVGGSISSLNTDSVQNYSWTDPVSSKVVYSKIRQVLADDEIYDNPYCIRNINEMVVISSEYTDIYKESIIMNNDSITLVIRDATGNVTGSCMLNAAKLNKLEQLLSD